jgi:hypothetical protein
MTSTYHKTYNDSPKGLARRARWRANRPLRYRCSVQRTNALSRGIPWLFTFESWLTFWGDKILLRGTKPDDLCCARLGDTGPYSPENCERITNRENGAQGRAKQLGAQ